jgi:hypothetical protein
MLQAVRVVLTDECSKYDFFEVRIGGHGERYFHNCGSTAFDDLSLDPLSGLLF